MVKNLVNDIYNTIAECAEAVFRERGSRFLAFAYPVKDEEEIKTHLELLRKKYYSATHHCYAWRLGAEGELSRFNDDGEPSGTAGRPILGQLLSNDLTNILVVVVRYFGGTKLGTAGLINAYRESAAGAIANSRIVEKTVNARYSVRFPYPAVNCVMKAIKAVEPSVLKQDFGNTCEVELSVRRGREEKLKSRLGECEGVRLEFCGYE